MAEFDFNIGARIHCQDGQWGKLVKLVINPETRQVTNLIVQKGFLLKYDQVLPLAVVTNATAEDIYLNISSDELDTYPEYHEMELAEPDPNLSQAEAQIMVWTDAQGMLEPVVPMVRRRICKGILAEQRVIERGTPVSNSDGIIGQVDHVIVNGESEEITHLVVTQQGFILTDRLVIPIAMVEAVGQDGIVIRGTNEALASLSRYTLRAEADILAELQGRLRVIPLDSSDINISLKNEVLHLTGTVSDVAVKYQVETIARAIEGVIDVENALEVENAIPIETDLDPGPRALPK